MGFILALLARLLFTIVGVINPMVVAIKYANKRAFWKVQNDYWAIDATELDIYGNYAYRATWNWLFQKEGYLFGKKRETISSALVKNKKLKKLTMVGKSMCFILGIIDKNHCEKSVK